MTDEEYLNKYQEKYGKLKEEDKKDILSYYHSPLSDKELFKFLEQYDEKHNKKFAKKQRKNWIAYPYLLEDNKKLEYELYGKYLSERDKSKFFGSYRGERMIYLTVGISGSGKTTYCKNHSRVIISPDEIREKAFGDINNQTHNRTVFDIAYYTLEKLLLSNGEDDIYFDATSLYEKSIKTFCDFCLDKANIKPTILVFKDSNDMELCYTRIKNDLTNGKNRANVPFAVLKKQYDNFKKLKFDNFENVKYV